MSIVKIPEYEPTEIVKISISDLTVPIDTAIELSKLAVIEKGILIELLKDAEKHKDTKKWILHPDTIYWAKELRMIIKDLNDMTKGVQEKAMLKKMDIVGDLYKEILKKTDDHDMVKLIKSLDKNDGESTITVGTGSGSG